MAKQRRDNAYYLMRLEEEQPAIFADWKAGKYASARQAIVDNVLKNAWKKAISTVRPVTVVDADGYILPAAASRVRKIMDARSIKMGKVMQEMGFRTRNPSLGYAMSGIPLFQWTYCPIGP